MTLKETIQGMTPEQAAEALTTHLTANPKDDEAYLLRGLRYWAMGKRARAINDYLKAIELNPDSPARTALAQANSILDFYDKDRFNP